MQFHVNTVKQKRKHVVVLMAETPLYFNKMKRPLMKSNTGKC